MSKTIYLIPGLGADKRVFEFLDLDPHSIKHIHWIDPLEDEAIENYAGRLIKQIEDVRPVLIGVSFGGIMAVEISKLVDTEKLILISSVRSKGEIPFYFKIFSALRLSSILPVGYFKNANRLMFWFFGIKSDDERNLLTSIVADTDPKFLSWSIDKILNWNNRVFPKGTTLIQGSDDRIFPTSHPDLIIKDGGHFMIVNRAKEISQVIEKLIGN